VTEYVWDHRNRLVGVIDRLGEGGPIVQSVEYVYDSQNRWIARSLDPDGAGPEPATATYFVYDDLSPPLVPTGAGSAIRVGQIILQLDDSGRVTNRYLWGPAVDQILADEQLEPDGTTTVLWTLTDHLNTVRDLALHDPATGATTIVNHLVYDAFGRITRQTDPTLAPLFAFTARPLDPATGLQNNLNRWYDAQVGRWVSEDPIGFAAADANLYRYVDSSPTNRTDPTGLRPPDDAYDAFLMGLINQAEYNYFTNRSRDELRAYVAELEAMRKLLKNIQAIIDRTSIFEFWPGGCQRWLDAFEANLRGFSNPLVVERNVGWEPSTAIGGGHAYYYFLLQDGTIIKVDHWIYYGGSRLRVIPPKLPAAPSAGSGGG